MGTIHETNPRDCQRLVIFTVAATPNEQSIEAAKRFDGPLLAVSGCGEALRHIMLMQPTVVVVLVHEQKGIAAAASLVSELRRRRPALPVIALGVQQDEDAERQLRAAGATAYATSCAGEFEAAAQLISAASTDRIKPAAQLFPTVHSGCSPPATHRPRGPARVRGQPIPRRRGG